MNACRQRMYDCPYRAQRMLAGRNLVQSNFDRAQTCERPRETFFFGMTIVVFVLCAWIHNVGTGVHMRDICLRYIQAIPCSFPLLAACTKPTIFRVSIWKIYATLSTQMNLSLDRMIFWSFQSRFIVANSWSERPFLQQERTNHDTNLLAGDPWTRNLLVVYS